MSRQEVWLFLLICSAFAAFTSVNAIECFVCDGKTNAACADPFEENGDLLKSCGSQEYCGKFIETDPLGVRTVSRYCAENDELNFSGCAVSGAVFSKSVCNTDKCNGKQLH